MSLLKICVERNIVDMRLSVWTGKRGYKAEDG